MSLCIPKAVTIVEVGPRDGLQSEANLVSTGQKIGLINALTGTGLQRIQVTSFVHPRRVPQLADAGEVLMAIRRSPHVAYSILVPNRTGLERALAAQVPEIEVFLSASESHNMLNVNRTIAQSLDGLWPVCEAARRSRVRVRASIATSFGCSLEGRVAVGQVINIARELALMGTEEIALGDTVGMANPRQSYQLFSTVLDAVPGVRLAAHFHDTRGVGLANALAALQAGITTFDSSIGGLGGCPDTPGVAGNLPTEDLVSMFEEMGVSTGIDLDRLVNCTKLAEKAVGHSLPGKLGKAGRCKMLL